MVVNSNGDVVPCCYDAHVQWVLGNVFRQSVAEVWRGKSFSEFRKRVLLKRNSIVACRECPVRRVNMTF
jgi:radical SAM protein with 4Fe4S-binding SPASM domain